ncbi:RNA degradosome polyphosphate kinase [Alkalicoccus urumqiensis]|uniref:Polyphosphate kinase n=1 Tax=Alkalicoccus urumqiensis TaxID=1548213 RepID=A0A2P6MFQ7_ALKUR|nr:RNA degradosome polyphosphate kinase [Alkalicoccus urumqiensis]PRO65129.1 RNA degradosome polyphosphate kinase [Alkalicoccus urumqiensis]
MTEQPFQDPSYYHNRELSWLRFNERVLEEAADTSNPLLERLKFLAIFSSNLDEFFMVRVAGLKDQVKAGYNRPENKTALTPKQQLERIASSNQTLVARQYHLLQHHILPELNDKGLMFLTPEELNEEEYHRMHEHFKNYILPVLTPLAIDAYRPFPMISNKSLNLAVVLEQEGPRRLAIVQVPSVLSRAVPVEEDGTRFVLMENVIAHFIDHLFTGHTILSVSPFRITRNADLTIHEEGARDLLREIEKELKKRKWGAAVRFEMEKDRMDPNVLSLLTDVLELDRDDFYEVDGPLDLSFFFAFYSGLAPRFDELAYETAIPQPPKDLVGEENIMDAMLKKDIFLHHPYESFQPVVDFIAQAAEDEQVLAIKQTLYRVSGDSPIIAALARAAELGKQVTVLVELKARFDEENNIQWAKQLEKAGCHVIYGITALKTHSKITLVVRHENEKIQRFVHLGTGNYNDSTAKLYTDMGMLTTRSSYGIDATNFFNYLSGFSSKPDWKEIATAPFEIREAFLDMIDKEIASHNENGNGKITAKMNSLTDKPIIMKLYEASCAGVEIELIIRGICCLKPGIPGVSENITVRSILGRFLEHSRIFYFYQNGEEAIYLSSADWMTRNMEKRIEIVFPVYETHVKARVKEVLDLSLDDNQKARVMNTDGTYNYVKNEKPPLNSQLEFQRLAAAQSEDS